MQKDGRDPGLQGSQGSAIQNEPGSRFSLFYRYLLLTEYSYPRDESLPLVLNLVPDPQQQQATDNSHVGRQDLDPLDSLWG